MINRSTVYRPFIQFCLAMALILACRSSIGQQIDPHKFPIPKAARSVAIDEVNRQIQFEIDEPIEQTAEFYKKELQALGWEAGFDQVAKIFANVYFKKDDKNIKVKAKRKDIFKSKVSYTVSGDGLAFEATGVPATQPEQETAVQTPDSLPTTKPSVSASESATADWKDIGIKDDDFPLFENQSLTRDGSMELIIFNCRKPAKENLVFFEMRLKAKDWKKVEQREVSGTYQLRFEKEGLYIRIGFWPHKFTDNLGEHDGISGAAEGTGIIWDDEPSGKAVERQIASADKFIGPLSPAKRRYLTFSLHSKREAAFWPEGKIPTDIVAKLPGYEGNGGESGNAARQLTSDTPPNVSQNKPDTSSGDNETPKSAAKKKGPFDGVIPEENEFKAHVTVNKKTFWLKHAIAFEGNWFDEKVPFVVFTEMPVSERDLKAAVDKGFDAQELFFLKMGRNLRVRCDEKTSTSGWAENLSFGSTDDLVAEVKIEDDRIKGTLKLSKLQKLGPFQYYYNAEFNLPKKW